MAENVYTAAKRAVLAMGERVQREIVQPVNESEAARDAAAAGRRVLDSETAQSITSAAQGGASWFTSRFPGVVRAAKGIAQAAKTEAPGAIGAVDRFLTKGVGAVQREVEAHQARRDRPSVAPPKDTP